MCGHLQLVYEFTPYLRWSNKGNRKDSYANKYKFHPFFLISNGSIPKLVKADLMWAWTDHNLGLLCDVTTTSSTA